MSNEEDREALADLRAAERLMTADIAGTYVPLHGSGDRS